MKEGTNAINGNSAIRETKMPHLGRAVSGCSIARITAVIKEGTIVPSPKDNTTANPRLPGQPPTLTRFLRSDLESPTNHLISQPDRQSAKEKNEHPAGQLPFLRQLYD